jgi:hypothetical protein
MVFSHPNMLWTLPGPVRALLVANIRSRPSLTACCYSTAAPAKRADPLRILFCGSDEFSIASLLALDHARRDLPGLIDAIHVAHRPAKPTGRGLKVLREGNSMLYRAVVAWRRCARVCKQTKTRHLTATAPRLHDPRLTPSQSPSPPPRPRSPSQPTSSTPSPATRPRSPTTSSSPCPLAYSCPGESLTRQNMAA